MKKFLLTTSLSILALHLNLHSVYAMDGTAVEVNTKATISQRNPVNDQSPLEVSIDEEKTKIIITLSPDSIENVYGHEDPWTPVYKALKAYPNLTKIDLRQYDVNGGIKRQLLNFKKKFKSQPQASRNLKKGADRKANRKGKQNSSEVGLSEVSLTKQINKLETFTPQLGDILSKHSNLTQLECSGRGVNDDFLRRFTHLRSLTLENTSNITDESISLLTNLKELKLTYSDDERSMVTFVSLQKLSFLQSLSSNQVPCIHLENLNLTELNLLGNKQTSLKNIEGYTNLTSLKMDNVTPDDVRTIGLTKIKF